MQQFELRVDNDVGVGALQNRLCFTVGRVIMSADELDDAIQNDGDLDRQWLVEVLVARNDRSVLDLLYDS